MDPEAPFFYANAMEIAMSQYDVSFNFLRQGTPRNAKAGPEVTPETLDRFVVSMSPQHAKAILAGLVDAVLSYEKEYGTIPLSAERQRKFESYFDHLRK